MSSVSTEANRADPVAAALAAYQRGDPAACMDALERDRPAWDARPDGWLLRGVASRALGRPDEAESSYRRAIALFPDYADAWNNLGNLYAGCGRHRAALDAYGRAAALRPDAKERASVLVALSGSAFAAGELERALSALGEAEAARPELGTVYNQRGKLLWELGHTPEAIESFRRAMACDPGNALYATNHLLVSQFSGTMTEPALAALARRAGQLIASEVPPALRAGYRPPPSPAPGERLRIAYLSSDFRASAPGFFIHSILAGHDRSRFEVWALSTSGAADALTDELRGHVDHWHDVAALGLAALTEWIRARGIHVLVDLNGFTGGHRLGVIVARAAPVQVSWLGYEGTTGLENMDAVLGDPCVTPPETESCYTESVCRLPFDFACYRAPGYAPEVAPAPAMRKGHVTFGSFNKLAKLDEETLVLWAGILNRVPGSRLLLKWRHAPHPLARTRIVSVLEGLGVQPDRVEFRDASPHPDMLAEYAGVDIALDPLPFSGGATTCDALWMGVPVVTRLGRRFAPNHTASHLRAAGLPHLVAGDTAEYADIAVRLAGDRAALAGLRASLRAQAAASPLCSAGSLMRPAERYFEALYRAASVPSAGA